MGDTPMALAPFFQAVLYGIVALSWAYAAMWAAVIAAAAYLLGRLRLGPKWPMAALKGAVVLPFAALAVWLWLYNGAYSVYAAYWALLFLLLGELHPVFGRGKDRERLPWLFQIGGAALPIISVLVTRNVVVLFLASLCGGVILLRGKE